MTDPLITRVTPERWQQAQEYERASAPARLRRGDDWNVWWMRQFDDYRALAGRHFENVLEVGCGPNTNVRLILPLISCGQLLLEDPLISEYMRMGNTYVNSLRGERFIIGQSLPLEDLCLADGTINLLICINVLDHVQNAEKCMAQMLRVLAPGGVLVLGQDLSNAEDLATCPASWEDAGHPIKLDAEFFEPYLSGFSPLLHKVLPREQGRNPKAHYGTLLYIGEKC